MKRFLALFLSILLLTGCAAPAEQANSYRQISMDAAIGLRPAPDSMVLTKQEKELVSLYRSLPPEGRKDLNRLLLHLTKRPET